MAWYLPGDKSLSERMMVEFTDANMCHYASINLTWFRMPRDVYNAVPTKFKIWNPKAQHMVNVVIILFDICIIYVSNLPNLPIGYYPV